MQKRTAKTFAPKSDNVSAAILKRFLMSIPSLYRYQGVPKTYLRILIEIIREKEIIDSLKSNRDIAAHD